MNKFTIDYHKNYQGEQLACKILSNYGEFDISKGKNKKWDLKGSITVEVKNDIYSKLSGNVGIEYRTKDNVPTGICSTQAMYYLIYYWEYDEGVWKAGFINVPTLKALTFLPTRKDVPGGDNYKSIMKLITTLEFKEYCDYIYSTPLDCFLYD